MNDSDTWTEVSSDDAISILETQIDAYQHIQEQGLRITRAFLALVAIFVTAISVVVSINTNIDWVQFLQWTPDILEEYARVTPGSYLLTVWQLRLARLGGFGGLLYACTAFLRGIYNAIGLLSSPELQPYTDSETKIRIRSNPSNGGPRYQKWINITEKNREQKIFNYITSTVIYIFLYYQGALVSF